MARALLAFGEIMLRLSPPRHQLLLQTPRFDVWVAGAEANVATQLALLGHRVAFASRVPDNGLGQSAIATLRGHGVDTAGITMGGDRMGLYFVVGGTGARAGEVVYDRAGSSFASARPADWDWEMLLDDVDRLHLSGITPALGAGPAAAAVAAARAASERGVAVSFDGNWRGELWRQWTDDPRPILAELVEHADLLFGNHRDIALLLDREDLVMDGDVRRAADAAFARFPKLEIIASTMRRALHGDLHWMAARIDRRGDAATTEAVELNGIVDRIGSGDAFAAGVLHALRSSADLTRAAETGLALAVLKHSLPGDAALFRQADIDTYLARGFDLKR